MSESMYQSWHNQAECTTVDPEIFFVGDTKVKSMNPTTLEAKKVCGSCAVRLECLEKALNNDEQYGIWGMMLTEERMQLKRRARRFGPSVV